MSSFAMFDRFCDRPPRIILPSQEVARGLRI